MKTLKTKLVVTILFYTSIIIAQNNITNFPPLTDEQKTALKKIPEFQFNADQLLKKSALPSILDNSKNIFFPPISNQLDWSCGQQSGVHYMFTYEINCLRNVSAAIPENQYPTHFTWNYLNRGSAFVGASYFDSWNIIKEFGQPNKSTFDPENNTLIWMNGYENYLASMHNRIEAIYSIRVDSEEGLLKLKNWLLNHAGDSEYGGVANYYGQSNYYNYLPDDSPEAGKQVITQMYDIATHALTIVGYNDDIRYDYNNDGRYTNDEDINNDGIVNMRDWEIGGFIVANSFSADWGNDGFTYVMYKLAAEKPEIGGFWNNTVNILKVRKDYIPKLTLKASIRYTSRHRIKVMAGFAQDTNATQPEIIKEFPILNYQGGTRNMQGLAGEEYKSIEFGLDITQFFNQAENGSFAKFFLIVNENDYPEYADGLINSFSVIDYSNNEEEIAANIIEPIPLHNGDNIVSLVKKIENNHKLKITSYGLPATHPGENFEQQLSATGGVPPYSWSVMQNQYTVEIDKGKFDEHTTNMADFDAEMNSMYGIDLNFTFPYYGKEYDKIFVTTNGSILFDENLFLYPYSFFKDFILKSRKAISVFGAPDQTAGQYYKTYITEFSDDAIQINWNMSQFYISASVLPYAAKLYKDGTIEFNFNDFDALGLSYVSGISNGNYFDYTASPYMNKQLIDDSTIVRFNPPENYFAELSINENGLLTGKAPEEIRETSFKVLVTDFTGAYDIKEFYYNTWASNIEELRKTEEIIISPNPVSEDMNIRIRNTNRKIDRIEIFNLMGEKILEKNIGLSTNQIQVKVKPELFKPGIYIIKATAQNFIFENKFIKK